MADRMRNRDETRATAAQTKRPRVIALALIGAISFWPTLSNAAEFPDRMPSREEMWQIILDQQQQIEALEKRQRALEGQQAETDQKVEATGDLVEQVSVARATGSGGGWWERTQLGGYGELHYNGGDTDDVDFHRFVLFASHQFNDRIRMFSELELEHAFSGTGIGEVELEQAFIEYDINDETRARTGLFLLPLGILNETHEPPTFFGVERNPVEKNIIPTTWWEAGLGVTGQMGAGLSYDLALHSGLEVPIAGSKAFLVRSGRQKVAKATAKDPAVTARLKWTGLPGIELAASGQWQRDITQGALNAEAFLFETHANIHRGPFGLRALYARWDIDGPIVELIGRDKQYGWYVEPSYRFETNIGEMGLFTRFSQWDNEAGNGLSSQFQQIVMGLNFWPHPDVVLKVDYELQRNAAKSDDNLLNLGVGFQF